MSTADATTCERLAGSDLLNALAPLPAASVMVTGYAGSGYSLVAGQLGEGVYRGKLPVDWSTPVLVVMGEYLSAEGVAMLQQLGVEDPWRAVASLNIGEALVLRRC